MESTRSMKSVLMVAAVLAFLGTFTLRAEAQMSRCSDSLMSLSLCMRFISSRYLTSPTQSCCAGLASAGLASAHVMGSSINDTKVLTLGAACNISTLSLSQCYGIHHLSNVLDSGSVKAGAGPPASPASAPAIAPGAASNGGAAGSASPTSAPSAESPKSSANVLPSVTNSANLGFPI